MSITINNIYCINGLLHIVVFIAYDFRKTNFRRVEKNSEFSIQHISDPPGAQKSARLLCECDVSSSFLRMIVVSAKSIYLRL